MSRFVASRFVARALRSLLVLALSLGLAGVPAQRAFAATFPIQSDQAATIDCDHLYYSNYRSGSMFDNDANGNPVITNRVVSRRPTGSTLPDYWSTDMAVGRDPDTGKPTLFYSNYTSGSRTLYKQVQGSTTVTDQISGGATRLLPPTYNWGGLGADPNSDMLYGVENLSASKQFFNMNLKTGASTVYQPTAFSSADTVWPTASSVPDIFIDSQGYPYMGVYGSQGTFLYRIDPVARTARQVVKITGPGALGGSIYGMAWFKGAVYLGDSSGNLYKVDPLTGVSTTVAGGTVQANTTGTPTAEGGGSWAITDLASCAVSPPLVPTLKVKKTATVGGATPALVKPGDIVTYTVQLTNPSAVPFPKASSSDDLTGVLTNASYNGDATAKDANGAAIGSFSATPPSKLVWGGTVPAGGVVTITYTVTVKADATDGATLRNTVTSNPESNCATGSTDTACGTTTPIRVIKVKVTKTASPANPLPGGKLTYTLTATNSGTTDYPNATISDDLTGVLPGATYNGDAAASSGAAPTYASPVISWTGTVPAGGSVRITYSVTVKDPVPAGATTLRNAVTTNVPGVCPAGSTDPACSTVTKLPRLEIVKSATPNPAKVGDKVSYTVTVRNTGEADYPGASVVDDLTGVLPGATYNGDAAASSGAAPTYAAPKLSWTGTVAQGATVTITYSVTATGASSKLLTNKVSADGSTCKDGCTNEVPLASLTVVKVSAPAAPKPGDRITYTITTTNTGQADYVGAQLNDDLTGVLTGADYNGDAAASAGAAPTYAAPKLSWTGTVPKGGAVTVTYSVTVKDPVPVGGTTLRNAVTTNIPGQCPPGSTDPNCSTVTKLPRLDIMKTATPNPAKVGGKVVYTVTVTNTGDADYPGASVADDLTGVLTGADYNGDATASIAPAPTYAAPKLTWTGTLAKGARVVLTYSVTVKTAATGSLINKVTADGSNCTDGSADPNCTTTTPVSAIAVTKTATPANPLPGGKLTYTVTVRGTGTADYVGASVVDDLTGVLTGADYNGDAAASSGAAPTYAAPKLTWSGTVPAGGSVTITYSVTVKDPVPASATTLRNAVTTNVPGVCPPGSTDPACSTVTKLPRLEIVKSATPNPAKVGDKVSYTVTVRNTGEADYPGASVVDDLTGVLTGADYNGDAAASSGPAPTYAAPKLSWSGTVAQGATVTITYSVTATGASSVKLTNTVTADGSSCKTGCTNVVPLAKVEVSKTSSPANPLPGGKLTYTLTLRNTGDADYPNAAVTDDLTGVLAGADYNADATASSGPAPTYAAPRLSWTGPVAKGATVTITYSVTVKDPVPAGATTLRNAVTTDIPGQCPPGSTDPKCSTVTKVPRLEVTKSATPNPAKVGDKVSYTVTVRNTGEADYPGASVVDDLTGVLTGATYNGDAAASSGAAPTYAAPKLRWTGTVAQGATVTITYSVTATGASSKLLTNKVSADGSTCKDGCTNEVPLASLTVVKVSSPKTPKPGDRLTYTISMTNAGQADYTGAQITDDLTGVLPGADYNGDATASAGPAPTYAAPTLSWTGTVAKGTTVTITYSVTVKNPVPAGATTLRNAVTTNIPDQCPPGSTDPNCSTVTKLPRLEIVKSATPNPAKVGDKIGYTVTVRNTGDADYPGASVVDDLTDVLPGATYNGDAVASSGAAPTYAAPKLTWSGTVPAGGSVTITYSVTATGASSTKLTNKVSADGSTCKDGCTNEVPIAKVDVSKTAAPADPLPGGKLTYTITLGNSGDADYPNATVGDDLSGVLPGADYNGDAASSAAPTPSYAAPKLSWTGTVTKGTTVTITYSVTVKNPVPAGATTLRNAVTTDIPGQCPPGSTEPKCSTVTKLPRLEVAKSATPNPARVGDKVSYTVTVRNTGEADYPGASVVDDLTGVLTGADYNGDAAASSGAAPTYAAPKLSWSGTVAQGATVTITYSVTATGASSTKLTNKVSADGSTCKDGCTNEVPIAKIEVGKTSSPASPKPGDKLTYTITARNTGEADYPDVLLGDDLTKVLKGADYNNDAAASTAPAPNYSAPLLTWRGTVAKGSTVTLTYSVTVKDPVPAGGTTLTNAVVTNVPDQCPPGSTDPKCSTVTRLPRLEIVKTADRTTSSPLRAGERVVYTVVARNTGDADDPDVTITDDLTRVLTGARYNGDATASAGAVPSYTAPKLTWTGALAAGGSVTLTYSVSVTNSGVTLVNQITADNSNCRPGSGDPACTTTLPTPSVRVVKQASPSVVRPGDTVTFTITVTNSGSGDHPGFVLTDDLTRVLTGARYNGDATASAGAAPNYTAPRLTWTGDVPAGGTVTIRYTVTAADPTPAGGEELRNSVSTNVPGVCPPGSTDPECAAVVELHGLAVSKTVDRGFVMVGESFTYTVTIRNTGATDYKNATLTDDLSDPLTAARYNDDATASSGAAPVYAAPRLSWTGDIPRGGSVTLTYSLRATGGTGAQVHNRVVAPDSNCAAGSADQQCTTTVQPIVDSPVYRTKVRKQVSPANPAPGDTVTFTLTMQNLSTADFPTASLTDDLSGLLPGATYNGDADARDDQGDPVTAPVYTAPKLSWGPAMLRLGATLTVTYTATVRRPLPAGVTSLRNTVVAAGSNCETGSTDPDCTTVTVLAELVLSKTASPGSVKVGEVVSYRITARNTGTADYTGAVIQDDLSRVLPWARYDGDAVASAGGAVQYAEPLLSWHGTVPAGGTVTLSYTVTALRATPLGSGLVNLAGASGSNCPLPMPRAAARGLQQRGAVDPRCSTTTPVYERVVPPKPVEPPPLPETGASVLGAGLLSALCAALGVLAFAAARRR